MRACMIDIELLIQKKKARLIVALLTSPKASSGGTYEREGVEGARGRTAAAWRG
jgi:hypothetical protein